MNLDKHLAFAPLIVARVCSSRCQASLPYVIIEVTADLYIDNFIARLSALLSKIARSAPHLAIASAILLLMSLICDPSTVKIVPRYLNQAALSSFAPSQCTFGSFFCASSTLFALTCLSAQVPLKF